MERRTGIRAAALVVLLSIALAVLSACAGGVAQEDYDAAKQQATTLQQQLTAKEQEVATAKQQLSAKEGEVTTIRQQLEAARAAGGQVTTLQQQLTAKEKEVADLKAITVLTWAKAVGTPTPRPTATPAPPGFTPVPAATVPPEVANEVIPFAFYVETILSSTAAAQYGNAGFPSCTPSTIFKRGTKMVWRFEVIDTSTGKRVTDLDKPTIRVKLPHGEELTTRYGKRGGTGPWTWVAAWDIPLDYPLGAFDYNINVTSQGRSGTFDQDNVALVRAATATAVGIDSRVQIVQ